MAGLKDYQISVYVANLLVTRLNITFNHNTLNKLLNISRVMAAVKNFLDDTDLLKILLT